MKNFILRYLKKPKLLFQDNKRGVIISRSANARDCCLEGKNKIYPHANVAGSSIGMGSYVGPYSSLHRSIIGRYCSIGPNVTILAGRHPSVERLSTHPCFYSINCQAGFTFVDEQNFEEFLFYDAKQGIYTKIGSDVWIGARVIIMGGVQIGHGAIIAAGSIVTKNVEDYSIVAGVPAKHLRYRFDEASRLSNLEDPWWDKDHGWLMNNLHLFVADRS